MIPPKNREAVVLLHGILNRPFVMAWLANQLKRTGYEVHNWGYPSRDRLIEQHAEELAKFVESLRDRPRLHFIGFSMGAIIIRYMLSHFPPANAGRFVMVGPPNHGSAVAQRMYRFGWFRWIYKDKAIEQMFSKNVEFFATCGIPAIEFGIIAGDHGIRGWMSGMAGPNDGCVTVESARLEGAKDFLVTAHQHTSLIFSPQVAAQTAHFLQHGSFKK